MQEARIILTGTDSFFGFMNIVFDYHLENKNIQKDNSIHKSVLGDINQKPNRSLKKILITDKIYDKKTKNKGSHSMEGKMIKMNFFPTELYQNHFMCSILSDVFLDLFLPQRCKHYDKFLKSIFFVYIK